MVALYLFALGLPLHNIVMSLLYGGGVRGGALDAIQAWKEIVLAATLVSVALRAVRDRRLPFQPNWLDALALAYGAIVVLYAVIPQSALDGHAGARAIAYGLRHDLVFVAAYFLGRAVVPQFRRVGAVIVVGAAAVAGWGLIEVYAVPIEWWRHSGAVGYFHRELGYDYHGPAGLPENFAFNTSDGLFRRLVSTFVSPLATAYMLVVALILVAADRRRSWLGIALGSSARSGCSGRSRARRSSRSPAGSLCSRSASDAGGRSPRRWSLRSAGSRSPRSTTTSLPGRTGTPRIFRTRRHRRR